MNLRFLAQADAVTLELETAKHNLELAKLAFETTRKSYDEMLSQADDEGIPKAKLKKITEERIQSLRESGMLELAPAKTSMKEAKPKKAKVKAVKDDEAEEDLDIALESEGELHEIEV